MKHAKTLIPLCVLVAGCGSAAASSSGDRPIADLVQPFVTIGVGASVTFDATQSYDPDNASPSFPHGIEAFDWHIVSAPPGSVAALDYSTAGMATFVPDVAGEYAGELVVMDQDGLESDPVPFGVTAEPMPALTLRLTWDSTMDLDLHLVATSFGGSFGDPNLDCHYANKTPDWGEPGANGDPVLVDDAFEYGPELIEVGIPSQATYDAYVSVFSNPPQLPGEATVEVLHNGATIAEVTQSLVDDDSAWYVGTIAFSDSMGAPVFTPDGTILPPMGY